MLRKISSTWERSTEKQIMEIVQEGFGIGDRDKKQVISFNRTSRGRRKVLVGW